MKSSDTDYTKSAFRDAISLRYGWKPEGMPTTCVCGKAISVEHAMSCKCGGLIINRHNEIRDISADLMSEVSSNVEVEPQLQPLTGEVMSQRSAVQSDEARLDIKADGFWGVRGQCAFFNVRVFNPYAPSNRTSTVQKCYIRHEREKRRSYEERIREVELSTFTPMHCFFNVWWGGTSCNSNDEKISITHCREEKVVFQYCNELDKKPVLLLSD